MGNTRYLTKSRYKIALECPTKLYYAAHRELYENTKIEDPFLAALADSGFQVGELAKLYFPGGVEITSLDHETALRDTSELLQRNEVTIYEAAFRFQNFFVRADVVEKKGDTLRIYEVKAKSFDPDEEEPFFDKRFLKKGFHKLTSKWQPYLYDIAFQTYVCEKAYPRLKVFPHLTLVDKSTTASVEGLNQKFLLERYEGRTRIRVVGETGKEALGERILCNVPVGEVVHIIIEGKDQGEKTREQLKLPSFALEAEAWAELYVSDKKHPATVSSKCKNCEFQNKRHPELRDGRKECLGSIIKPQHIAKPTIFEIWNSRKVNDYIEAGKLLLENLVEDDVKPKDDDNKLGLSSSQRQWLQVEYAVRPPADFYFDREALSTEMSHWKFPLHFIDFETTMVALPFHKGRRPYEQVAFQFSHHVVFEGGLVAHADQYIHDKQGELPNFHFVRALKKALERDGGTIFRYSNHENTVLVQIYNQLNKSSEPDREELMAWIKTITHVKDEWTGARTMVDLCEMVKRHFYHPATKGSNSIKYILPAILSSSKLLQEKYAQPIYGSSGKIPSLNFKDKVWIEKGADGSILDPYKSLDPIFKDVDVKEVDLLTSDDELNNGGAASVAYARMQFTEMSAVEREALRDALLRYCELDTLAMVMLYEAWVGWMDEALKEKNKRA